jgi:peptidyl-prolyl cis-trans isomerase SurA
VRLHFEEGAETRPLLLGQAPPRQRQTRQRVRLDFFQQVLHGCRVGAAVCGIKRPAGRLTLCATRPSMPRVPKNITRALVTAVVTAGFGWSLPAEVIVVNGIKAIVHDAVVTKQEVELSTAPAAELLFQRLRNQPEEYQRQLKERLDENLEARLQRQLILRDFKTGGYNLPESIIQGVVDEQIRTRYGDRDKLIKSLNARGMTYERFRQQAREDIIISALRGKNISQEIIASPHKIESFYLANQDKFKVNEEVKLRVIVLNIPVAAEAAVVRQKAEKIRAEIKAGAAFSEMATKYSQGRQRDQGGDWGWIQRFDLDGAPVLRKELAEPAFALKPGEMSEVLVVDNMCYLMLVEDRRSARIKPLSDVRGTVEQTLLQEERARLEKLWIDRLRKKTFVRYL